jgi:hypothetical protein
MVYMPSSLKKHSSGEVSRDSSQVIHHPLTTTLQIEIGFCYLLVLVVLETIMDVLVDLTLPVVILMVLTVAEQVAAAVELKTPMEVVVEVLTELELPLSPEAVSQVVEDRVDPLEVDMMDGMVAVAAVVTVVTAMVLDTVVEDRVMLIHPCLAPLMNTIPQQVPVLHHIGI